MKKTDVKSPSHAKLQRKAAKHPFFSRARGGDADHNASFFPSQSPVQAKLKVHPADDAFEREADKMADKAVQEMHAPAAASPPPPDNREEGSVQKKPLQDARGVVQTQRAFESPSSMEQNSAHAGTEEMPLQAKSESEPAEAPPKLESQLAATKGSGSPLPEPTRNQMESSFNTDFSNVRVHTGPDASRMNDDINARAFTHGNDIYFNKGEYQPDTSSGAHLLAHELTHTVQQEGGVSRKPATAPAAVNTADMDPDEKGDVYTVLIKSTGVTYKIDAGQKEIVMPVISLPKFKQRNANKFKLPLHSLRGRGATAQVDNWTNAVKSAVNAKVSVFLQNIQPEGKKGEEIYFLQLDKNENFHLIGTKEQIQERTYIPKWNRDGKTNAHQVDHVLEWQLGGGDQPGNQPDNYELTDAKANISSGSAIKNERYARINTAINYFNQVRGGKTPFPKLPNEKEVKEGYIQQYEKIINWELPFSGDGNVYWSLEEIKEGVHLKHLKSMSGKKIQELKGKANEAMIYVSESLGKPKTIALPYGGKQITNFYAGIDLQASTLDAVSGTENDGSITFKLREDFTKKMKTDQVLVFDLVKIPGRLNTYYIRTTRSFNKNMFTKFEDLSPVTINELSLDDTHGLMISGTIITDLPLFKGLEIDFTVSGGELSFVATIPMDIITQNFPKLFKVTGSYLKISYSSKKNAIGLEGYIRFMIDKIGEGEMKAGADGKGFKVAGNFIFDKSKFDGQLRAAYSSQKGWSFGGSARMGPDKLKGVKEANISFDYENGMITIDGGATLTVPGVKSVKIHSTIGKDGDFVINAEATLAQLPGIKGGNVKIIIKSPKGGDMSIGVSGTATPDFPGVPGLSSEVSFMYNDGAFEVRAVVDYNKGRFKGRLELGLTNRSVDEKGQPQGEPKEDAVIVFGYGSLTVDLFKGSTGTISARYTPEKTLLVAGQFNMQNLAPFGDGVDIHKKILDFPSLKIPIVGVPGVSIFFEISGGAYFKFNWQPLLLKELSVTFQETNINEIENAQVDITGAIGSKASAEAYMEIKASIGAQVLVASIKGSLGGQAGIGVEGEAGGAISATWNNEKGLQLKEILATVSVNPKAIFRLTGSVSVDLDLWLTTINLYYKEWVLAEGAADLSALSLKVSFPIKFDEKGDLIRPDDMSKLNVEQPAFDGDQGKAALDAGINGDAQKERKLAKEKLRAQIANDIRNSVNDTDFSPTQYAKNLQKKYQDDAELKTFIMDSVDEEVKMQELREFEELKTELRKSPVPLNEKVGKALVFKLWRPAITQGDFDAFVAELRSLEEQKKAAPATQPLEQDV